MRGRRQGSAAKGVLMGLAGLAAAGAGGVGWANASYIPTVRPNTYVADIAIGGLTQSEAMREVELWFEEQAAKPLKVTSDYLVNQPKLSAKDLGAKIDRPKTLARFPMDDFWSSTSRKVMSSATAKTELVPVYDFDSKRLEDLAAFIEDNIKAGSPARAKYEGGRVVHTPEIPGMKLDDAKLSDTVSKAMLTGEEQELQMVTAPKKVPDEALETIREVESRYATSFNSGQRDRSANIALAAKIIDGMVLMPGERFSFNQRVGRRTAKGGFRTAGVFVMGRKEYDIGGGICQVSTTLYNAALLADLKIVSRSSHSRPVPYVPIGRDAAVSYPNPDLVIENSLDRPIAFASEVQGGRITFRVLGAQKPDFEVTIVAGKVGVRDNGVKYVQDDTLGYGVEKVLESGASRRTLQTWRVVTRDGVEIKRESLGQSFYSGTPRIIARNAKAKPAAATPPAQPSGGGAPEAPPTTGGTDPASSPTGLD